MLMTGTSAIPVCLWRRCWARGCHAVVSNHSLMIPACVVVTGSLPHCGYKGDPLAPIFNCARNCNSHRANDAVNNGSPPPTTKPPNHQKPPSRQNWWSFLFYLESILPPTRLGFLEYIIMSHSHCLTVTRAVLFFLFLREASHSVL